MLTDLGMAWSGMRLPVINLQGPLSSAPVPVRFKSIGLGDAPLIHIALAIKKDWCKSTIRAEYGLEGTDQMAKCIFR